MQNELASLKSNPVSTQVGPLIFGPGEIAGAEDVDYEEGSDTSRPRTPNPAADVERVVPFSAKTGSCCVTANSNATAVRVRVTREA